MSENVFSVGYMCVLSNPTKYEDLNNLLEQKCSCLCVNYEGTMIYSESVSNEAGMSFLDNRFVNKDDFISECHDIGIEINIESIKFYTCGWYNGGDNDMSLMTLDEYLQDK